jgi:hypothetical protein
LVCVEQPPYLARVAREEAWMSINRFQPTVLPPLRSRKPAAEPGR